MTSHASEAPRILFFDVDGTLIYHKPGGDVEATVANARPSEGVASAFQKLRERGHRTFICTGRPLCLIAESLLELQPTGIISSAGACVSVGDDVLFDYVIEDELIDRLLNISERSSVPVLFEGTQGDAAYVPQGVAYSSGGNFPIMHSRDEMERRTSMHFAKFVVENDDLEAFMCADPELFENCFDGFDLALGITEFSARGIDKGYGVRRALDKLGLSARGTYAFGDSENDLPMADAVETFVAMGNAMPEVKARATYVTDPVQDDGVVTALEHFGLL